MRGKVDASGTQTFCTFIPAEYNFLKYNKIR